MSDRVPDELDPRHERDQASEWIEEASEPADEVAWQRLSRRMLIVHPLDLLKGLIPLIIVALLGQRAASGGSAIVNIVTPIIAAVLALVVGVGRWWSTRFRFAEGQLQLRRGLLNVSRLTTRLDRVRSVELVAPPIHRLLRVSKVQIGTGVDGERIELDSLTHQQAVALREELLARIPVAMQRSQAGAGPASMPVGSTAPPPTGLPVDDAPPPEFAPGDEGHPLPAYEPEIELARLNPSWLRYAPFGLSGLAAAATLVGLGFQVWDELGLGSVDVVRSAADWIADLSALFLSLAIVVLLATLWPLFSMASYVLAWWGLAVMRGNGTIRVVRGLLTQRSSSIEEARIRGAVMGDQILLRTVRGANLKTLATGVGEGGTQDVLPPAPLAVVEAVGAVLLEEDGILQARLRAHGPGARRRRHTRAQWLTVGVLVAIAPFVIWWDASPWWLLAGLPVAALSAWLAEDRYRQLGHALRGRYLVRQEGSIFRQRVALERAGVIGWVISESFFQRRVGVATLTATTAAGAESYDVVDLPAGDAVPLAHDALPGLLDPFLVR